MATRKELERALEDLYQVADRELRTAKETGQRDREHYAAGINNAIRLMAEWFDLVGPFGRTRKGK